MASTQHHQPHQPVPRGAWLFIAASWGLFLFLMYRSGVLIRVYQTQPYHLFTGIAGIVLLLLAAKAVLWPAAHNCSCCSPDHTHDDEPCDDNTCDDDELCKPAHIHPGAPDHDVHAIHRHTHHHDADTGDDSHGHAHTPPRAPSTTWPTLRALFLLTVLAAPVALALLVPAYPLNALAAERRGAAIDPAALLAGFRQQKKRIAEMEGNYHRVDVLEALEMAYADLPAPSAEEPAASSDTTASSAASATLAELKVTTIGFVSRRGDLPDGVFRLIRFKIACCAADAQPIVLLVRWPASAQFVDDTWVKVLGTLRREIIDGRPAVIIHADAVTDIPAPAQPYL